MTVRAPRQRKTPRQRAEEALGVAERRVTFLTEKAARLRKEWDAVCEELREAAIRAEFLSGSPDLDPPEPDDPLPITDSISSTNPTED